MGSTFTTFPDVYDQTSLFGTKKKLPIYLQFVPCVVTEVINGLDSENADLAFSRIGSIKALPHFTNKGIKKKSMLGEDFRYWPLLRGIQDIPTKGDPVLLCDFGGVNYYLGPLNTESKPNFNIDKLDTDEVIHDKSESPSSFDTKGTSPNFKEREVRRLHKLLNVNLDNPNNEEGYLPKELHGDLVFEGRHGNSLRIGSRNINPYMIIQNGRPFRSIIEMSLHGSITAFLEKGSIREHFINDKIKNESSNKVENYLFTLADSEIEEPKRTITNAYKSPLGRGVGIGGNEDSDITKTIYGFGSQDPKVGEPSLYTNQILHNSDRITINAKKDCIFLSAFKHIHMGSGNVMTYSTSKNILMEAETTLDCNIGEEVNIKSPIINLGEGEEPLAKGNTLKVKTIGLQPGENMHEKVLSDGLSSNETEKFTIEEIKELI